MCVTEFRFLIDNYYFILKNLSFTSFTNPNNHNILFSLFKWQNTTFYPKNQKFVYLFISSSFTLVYRNMSYKMKISKDYKY